MRGSWGVEHLGLVLSLAVASFVCADEEPLLDLSDFNLLHVWLLVLAGLATYFDLSLRARAGQYLAKDLTVAAAAFTFTWGLENYVRLLLLVFCLHNLLPLEVDLLELVEAYQAWGAWLAAEVAVGLGLLGLLVGLAYGLNLSLGAGSAPLVAGWLLLLCLGHLGAAVVLAWDLAVAGFAGGAAWEEAAVFYLQPKSALTYDRALGAGDLFEWHRERGWPYSVRFEDLYFFFFQLLLVWDLLCGLFFWLCALASQLGGGRAVSYLQVGLGLVWLEHLGLALAGLCLGMAVVGLRVWARVPGELGAFWG